MWYLTVNAVVLETGVERREEGKWKWRVEDRECGVGRGGPEVITGVDCIEREGRKRMCVCAMLGYEGKGRTRINVCKRGGGIMN